MIRRALLLAPVMLFATVIASAQQNRIVTCVIRDSATARPLAGTLVTLTGPSYQEIAQSRDDGAFQFTRVKPGRYTVAARRLGYAPFNMSIDVTERSDTIRVSLLRIATMDTMRVRAGMEIYGIIGTARDLRALPDVEVQVVGSGATARTDSSGRFFVSLSKQGVFVVRTRVAGYASRTASVTVTRDSVTELMLLLDQTSAVSSNKSEAAWRDFSDRVRMRGAKSALVPRTELLEHADMGLIEAIQRASSVTGKNLRFGSTVCVFVEGFPSPTSPVSGFHVDAIEAVEVYTADPRSDETHTLARQSRGYECHPTGLPPSNSIQRDLIKWVVIWLKK